MVPEVLEGMVSRDQECSATPKPWLPMVSMAPAKVLFGTPTPY